MNAKELRQAASRLWSDNQALLDRAKTAGRALTDEELTEFDRRDADINAKLEQAERLEKHNGHHRTLRDVDHAVGKFQEARQPWTDMEEDAGEVRALRDGESAVDYLRARGRIDDGDEFRKIGLGRYLRAMVLGPRTDAERRALSEGTDSAGGYTVPDVLAAPLIDALRERARVFQAGARIVPLDSDRHSFAKVASDPVPAWRAEAGNVLGTDPTFTSVVFTPQSLAILVRASRELLEDSVNINEALPRLLTTSLAQELDRVALVGTGAGNEPQGISGAGIGDVDAGGVIADYADMVAAVRTVLEANAEEPDVAIMAPREFATYADLLDTTNQPMRRPDLLERIRFLQTMQIDPEREIYVGGFRSLWVGIRTEARVEVLRERYADTLEYGFLAYLRADVQLEHAGALCKISGIVPPS